MISTAHTSVAVFTWLAVAVFLPTAHGNNHGFLGFNPELEVARVRGQVQDLIAAALGGGHGVEVARLNEINSTISPMFDAMPKNSDRRISAPAMRHLVHRYFGEAHGWIVRGFEPHVENTSSYGGKILRSNLPDFARHVIEKDMSHGGFALQDVVSAVVVVEQLILTEALQAVHTSYRLNDQSETDVLDRENMLSMLHSYIIVEMLEGNSSDVNQHFMDKSNIQEIYPNWDRSALFLEDLTSDHEYQQRYVANPFTSRQYFFEDTVRIAQEFSQEFSRWSNHECQDMKEALVNKDTLGTGRIRLADFYGLSKGGAWQFLESSQYLRQLGALDESSEALGPQVIIPNYVTGMSNCISSTPFYSACCVNECMGLMHTLESHIRAPSAPASEIIKAVELIVSSSMETSRKVSASLRTRLDEVASIHGGTVPLHGRLLAQWIHYAFPRECPFPHVTGTMNPQTPGQWSQVVGDDALVAADDEIEQYLSSAPRPISPDAGLSMWSLHEELLAAPESSRKPSSLRSIARVGVLVVMLASVALFVSQHVVRIQSFFAPPKKNDAIKEYII